MYRTDFVFTVLHDFVRNCQTPVLIVRMDITDRQERPVRLLGERCPPSLRAEVEHGFQRRRQSEDARCLRKQMYAI